ncbi:3-oxoadipate enol-lactonase [Niveispirillum sp. SYP-B3756]|uniref:3-oxoadipate enol-lactonase n=1 Tax=Niveispirillum sp. SYP-B3756 TaxID=2662178 RepID=UPI001B3B8B83|nr:3-oxoadipate enol-lactonase [Niveispirillum sp. SYP-B3756]
MMQDRSFLILRDGCRLAYRFDGPAEAPVLLLSNSLGTDLGMWDAQMPALCQRFRVLRYDSRGHGASAAPPGAYSMDRLGCDVLELLGALGLDKVDFCGLSKGGMVGQWLGWRAPDRFRRLVLANTAAFMGPPENWQKRIDSVLRDGMGPLAEASLARWFTPGFIAAGSPALAAIRSMLLANDPVGYAGCCAAIRDMDQRRLLSLIDLPTLIIGGSHDPATPMAEARFLRDHLPQGRLVELAAAHLSNVEQPAGFTAALLDFLG